jgi:glycosyltransferase involved in cell wall biosynthesis
MNEESHYGRSHSLVKVSVLISSYNGEKFIKEQLNSLLKQSRKIDEVVIIDDCSTDDTVAIIKQYIIDNQLENEWKIIVNKKNKGWKANFIEGIEITTGDILFFCDQDDIWLKDKVKRTLEILQNNPNLQVVSSRETLWHGEEIDKLWDISDKFDVLEFGKPNGDYLIHCSGCTMAIRRKYYERIKTYYVSGWAHDDFFWKFAVVDGKFGLMHDSAILHRIHGKNESRKRRTFEGTVTGYELGIKVGNALINYANDTKSEMLNYNNKISILEHKTKGDELRLRYMKEKKLVLLIELACKYSDLYRRKRQILVDWCLVHGIHR